MASVTNSYTQLHLTGQGNQENTSWNMGPRFLMPGLEQCCVGRCTTFPNVSRPGCLAYASHSRSGMDNHSSLQLSSSRSATGTGADFQTLPSLKCFKIAGRSLPPNKWPLLQILEIRVFNIPHFGRPEHGMASCKELQVDGELYLRKTMQQ